MTPTMRRTVRLLSNAGAWIGLVAVAVLAFYNPDMSKVELFLTYWPVLAVVLVLGVTAALIGKDSSTEDAQTDVTGDDARAARLVEALEWYADSITWDDRSIEADRGQRARDALVVWRQDVKDGGAGD